MTRKMLTAAIAVVALLVSVLSLGAYAQGSPTCPYYSSATAGVCADAVAYPGPFAEHPPAPTGPYGWGAPTITAAAAADAGDTGGGDASAGLAHTGSEATVFGYVGVGLIAFGAVAMGSRRKFFQGALD